MEKFLIEGGHPARGSVTPAGNKNEALPCLAAAMLTSEPVTLTNVPRIKDVEVTLSILEQLGASVEWTGDHQVTVTSSSQGTPTVLDPALCRRIRASILFAGPILARFGEVVLPPPGGDVIGRRRVDTHLVGFERLGAIVEIDGSYTIRASKGRLEGTDFFFDEQSVTATENLVMAAALAKGTTILRNVAMEPHVQGLCHMLVAMGASIEGLATSTLVVHGVDQLHGCSHRIGPDYLEIGSLMGLAAVTGGDLTICDVEAEDLRMIRLVFERLGVISELRDRQLRVYPSEERRIRPDFLGHIPKIDDAPWPAFPTDLMSVAITTATQSAGTVLFFEKMFEGRMFFVDHLINMGAQIILCDPHRVVVVGPSQLYASSLESPDIRAGMALLLAACCAQGKSTISNVRQIDRGYEAIDSKLRSLGLRIERVQA